MYLKIIATYLILWSQMSQITFCQETFNYKDDFKNILEQTKKENSDLAYNKLLNRFNVNDTTLTDYEVLALLIGFTAQPAYKPYDVLTQERDIYNLNDVGKYQEGLKMANEFLETNPFNIKTLYEKSYSFSKLNQKDSAEFYLYKGFRIFQAMFFSGDGKSKETPTFALGPADGQDYIKKFIGAKIGTMGSGSDPNGNFLDILEMRFEEGESITLYFIIEHAVRKMFDGKSYDEAIGEKKKKKKRKRD